ncbi:MAG: hypothetical protein DMG42_29810 [Acidobacteria bacterium]|nr:MAG: hypothetical protein DMG42_29810 [Acidobacteriota bacterium]
MRTRKLLGWCILLWFFYPGIYAQQEASRNPGPDARYKVDGLVIVGHPDDDIEVAAYLAKMIEQERKRFAVVYTTRGNSGGNAIGYEQSTVLADVREMEARRSLATYGVNHAWFLHGSDTPGADVLHSLEAWGHGQALEEVVRLVRLTRPEVILTCFPITSLAKTTKITRAREFSQLRLSILPPIPSLFPSRSLRRATGSTSVTMARASASGNQRRSTTFRTPFTSISSRAKVRNIAPTRFRLLERFPIRKWQRRLGVTTRRRTILPTPSSKNSPRRPSVLSSESLWLAERP